nr:MAG TPA: hypothetical protein [Caudoviricetes sp.]
MPKAVLVMDMPESCFGCNFMYCDEENDTETCQATETARDIDLIEDRPDWCPLRELPEKIPELKSGYEDVSTSIRRVGWNACLDEIVKTDGMRKE